VFVPYRWPLTISLIIFCILAQQSSLLSFPTGPVGNRTDLERGVAALRAHQYSEAIRWFTSALKTESAKQRVASAYVNRGIASREPKRFDEEADFENAIRVSPYFAVAGAYV